MVPRVPMGCAPKNVPDVEGVARTFKVPAITWMRSFDENFVEGDGVGVGVGVGDGVGVGVGTGTGVPPVLPYS